MKITKIIHDNGGQVYMDGANMNARWNHKSSYYWSGGCHLNLHKTFAIPRGNWSRMGQLELLSTLNHFYQIIHY